VEVGDLVRLSCRKTRKGFRYENMLGLIVEISNDFPDVAYAVNFTGTIIWLGKADLSIVNE